MWLKLPHLAVPIVLIDLRRFKKIDLILNKCNRLGRTQTVKNAELGQQRRVIDKVPVTMNDVEKDFARRFTNILFL